MIRLNLFLLSIVCGIAPLLPVQASEKPTVPAPSVYFSPQDHLADALISQIRQETVSIRAAVYALTHKSIAQSLANAKKRGVDVEVVVDPFSLKRKTALNLLAKGQVPVWIWQPKTVGAGKLPLMHDKFCVFGKHTVWTGSFNFTYDADEKNEENAIVLKDADLVEKFLKQFEKIKSKGVTDYIANVTK